MSAESTGRVIDPHRDYNRAVREAVRKYEFVKAKKKERGFKNQHVQLTNCSQCKGLMKKDFADKQIENKRENAPICMACIMGYERKPKGEKNYGMRPYSPQKQKEFANFKKRYAKSRTRVNVNFDNTKHV